MLLTSHVSQKDHSNWRIKKRFIQNQEKKKIKESPSSILFLKKKNKRIKKKSKKEKKCTCYWGRTCCA